MSMLTRDTQSGSPVIAIVDDEPAVASFLGMFLRRLGYSAQTFSETPQLIPWLDANHCDALILDLHMPDIDGFTLLCMLRGRFPNLPVIIFSGMGCDAAERQAMLDAGAFDYLCKGSSMTETLSVIQRALARKPAEQLVA